MQISDKFLIQAPIDTVWDFFLDVERMSKCMPGVESVEAVGDNAYRGRLGIKVGPVSASFSGTVTLTDLEPPRRVVALAEAEDKGAASAVKIHFTANLSETDGGTEVAYDTDVTLRGRLAQFGAAVMSGTARKMTAQFAENVRAELES